MNLVDGNYIKLNRKLLDWEWYGDINTCRLFIHILLSANWKQGNFLGKVIERGQYPSSIEKLSTQTGLSIQQTRTALEHLKSTNEITSVSTSKFSVFTVVKYGLYQTDNKQNNKQITNNQQARQQSNNNNRRNKELRSKEVKNIYGEFKHVLLNKTEYERLKNDFGETRLKQLITELDEGIELKGYKYKNHNLAIRKWAKNDSSKAGSKCIKQNSFNNFTQRKYDFNNLENRLLKKQLEGRQERKINNEKV